MPSDAYVMYAFLALFCIFTHPPTNIHFFGNQIGTFRDFDARTEICAVNFGKFNISELRTELNPQLKFLLNELLFFQSDI